MGRSVELTWDVVVVGGGPAGLSAALILGRSRRRVLVCDSGRYRNAVSKAMHGFLSRDGEDPAEMRRIARQQLEAYDGVEVRDVTVTGAAACEDEGFAITLETGERVGCRKLLLATGVVDVLPPLEGFDAAYGTSAFHCPYCDGWERRDQPLAVYGEGKKAKALALELLGWSKDLVVVTGGPSNLADDAREELARLGIRLDERPIAGLEHEGGQLRALRFCDGDQLPRSALFFATPDHQHSELARGLGCDYTARGAVATRSYEKTNVPGVYVAGDASRRVDLVIVAAAEGALAAFAINAELLAEDRSRATAPPG